MNDFKKFDGYACRGVAEALSRAADKLSAVPAPTAKNAPAPYRKTALVPAEQFLPAENKIPAGVISDGPGDPRAKGSPYSFVLDTIEGRHVLRNGDYICTGPKGEKWNVEQSIFESTYELVTPAPTEQAELPLVGAHGYWASSCIDKGARQQSYSSAQMRTFGAQQRQDGRRDTHEKNIVLLSENCKLTEELLSTLKQLVETNHKLIDTNAELISIRGGMHPDYAARQVPTFSTQAFGEWCITKWHELGGDIHAFARPTWQVPVDEAKAKQAVREVMKFHKLTEVGDGVIEADIVAAILKAVRNPANKIES